MSSSFENTRDERINRAIAEYLQAAQRGDAPGREAWLAQHADLAKELAEFFDDQQRFQQVAAPLKGPIGGSGSDAPTMPLTATPSFGPGTKIRFFGQYELLDEIARGGMGVVYKARQLNLKRIVALKMILTGQLASPQDIDRFRVEAEAAAKLNHPNIVPIYEVGEHEGFHYFSMALVDGVSLARKLTEGVLDPRAAAELIKPVAEAIAYAHVEGVIHRDLKPGNILIDRDGNPHVTDFGLAKRVEGEAQGLTATGQALGTPSYMPPEQAQGDSAKVGPAADVYSLGAVLYCMVTGRPPFQAANPVETILQVLTKEPVSPRQLNSAVPRDLETIILKCLEKDPAQRYRSARDLHDELQRFVKGEPIIARPIGAPARAWRWCRRNPREAISSGVALAALILFSVTSMYSAQREKHNALRLAGEQSKTLDALNDSKQKQLQLEQEQKTTLEQRLKAEELLSQSQAEKGVRLLEQENPRGLLSLLEARRTVEGVKSLSADRTMLWSAWFTQYGNQLHQVVAANGIMQVAFSPDGNSLAAQGPGNRIQFWNVSTGEAGPSFGTAGENLVGFGHAQPMVYTADGKSLFTFDHRASKYQLWDVATQKPSGEPFALGPAGTVNEWCSSNAEWIAKKEGASVQVFERRTGNPFGKKITLPSKTIDILVISPDGKSLVTVGDRIQAWNITTGETLGPATPLFGNRPMSRALGPDRLLVFSPDGQWYAAVSEKTFISFVQLFDATTGETKHEAWEHAGSKMPGSLVAKIKFSPDGSLLATMSTESLELREVATGKLRGQPLKAGSGLYDFAFSPDSRMLVTAHGNGSAQLWSTATGGQYGAPLWHHDPVSQVTFNRDGTLLATVSGGTARCWQTEMNEPWGRPVLQREDAAGAAFSPDSKIVASIESGFVHLWNCADGKSLRPPLEQAACTGPITFSGNGEYLAAAVEKGVQVWDTKSWKPLDKPLKCDKDIEGFVEGVTISPDGRWVAAMVRDGVFHIWNRATGKPYDPLIKQDRIQSVFFDPTITHDGKLLSARGSFGMVVVDLVAGKRIEPSLERFNKKEPRSILWTMSPDGRWHVELYDGKFRIRDSHTQAVGPFITLPSPFFSIVFNHESTAFATAFEDGTVRVWDAATGQPLGPVISTPTGIAQIAFRPGGKQLATLSSNGPDRRLPIAAGSGTIRRWEIATGLQLGSAQVHSGENMKIAFSPDGCRLLASSMLGKGKLQMCSFPNEELSLREIELRTWLSLGMRLDSLGVWEPIPGDQWQEYRKQLQQLEARSEK